MSEKAPNTISEKIPFSKLEGIAYFCSALGIQFVTATYFMWSQVFYHAPKDENIPNQIFYTTFALASSMLLLARVTDAVSDPLVGYWSDRTRSKLGRRRPWIIYASIPTCISFILFWFPPIADTSIWNFVFGLVISIIFWWAVTMVLIPLLSLTPEVGGTNEGRVEFAKYWGIGLAVGFVIANLSGFIVDAVGAKVMGVAYGIAAFACFQFAGWTIKERFDISKPYEDTGETAIQQVKSQFRQAFKLKAFRVLTIAETIFSMAIFLINIVIVEYTLIVLDKDEGFVPVLLLPFIIVCLVASFFIPKLAERFGKKTMYTFGLGGFGAVFFGLGFVGILPDSIQLYVAFPLVMIAGLPQAVKYVLPYVLIGDVADEDAEVHNIAKREAVFAGALGFAMKMGMALSYVVRYAVYAPFGEFSKGNETPVILVGPVTGVICLFACYIFAKYYPDYDRGEKSGIV